MVQFFVLADIFSLVGIDSNISASLHSLDCFTKKTDELWRLHAALNIFTFPTGLQLDKTNTTGLVKREEV